MKKMLVVAIATFLGSGKIRFAPGTWGSLAALPLVYYANQLPTPQFLVFTLLLIGLGSWAAAEYDLIYQSDDHPSIVIDEVAGMLLACAFQTTFLALAVGFLLFRLFDITKPPPIRQLDAWSKAQKVGSFKKGFGVVADDLLAGIFAFVALNLIQDVLAWP